MDPALPEQDRCREQEVDSHKRHINHKKTILRFLCFLWFPLSLRSNS